MECELLHAAYLVACHSVDFEFCVRSLNFVLYTFNGFEIFHCLDMEF